MRRIVDPVMIVLDTNIIISYIQDDPLIIRWVDQALLLQERFVISSLTIVELLGFKKLTERDEFAIEQWLHQVLVIDIDSSLARKAARLRRNFSLTTTDSIIAATAASLYASLVSRDKVFAKVKDIKTIVP